MHHLPSNIPSTIFYKSTFSEPFRVARCTLRINDFLPRASDLFSRIIAQCGNRAMLTKQLKKGFHHYPTVFRKFCKIHEEINIVKIHEEIDISIMKNT